MINKTSYGVRWSGDTKVWKVKLPEKSTVKEVLLGVSKKIKLTDYQLEYLIIRGSFRPQDEYSLNQLAPVDDILVIFSTAIGNINST